jgi:hypothetical protein
MTSLNISKLSPEEFALLGTNEFVYVKEVDHEGEPALVIHLANGQPVALIETWEAARQAAGNYNVELLSVH